MAETKEVDFINKTVLPNGLQIVTEHIESVKSVTAGIWVKTGSRNESDELAGVTHYLEHMLFKGTEKRSSYDIALSMESVGGYLNAFTSTEYTCYYSRCLDTKLPLALDVLTDMVRNSTFPDEEMEKEKKVVLEEMKMYADSPQDVVFEEFSSQVFNKHPIGRPIIGFEDTVSSFTRQNLFDYMEDRYQPSNLLLAVAGNVNHDEVVKMVEELMDQPNQKTVEPVNQPLTPYEPSRKKVTKPIEQTHMIIGRRGLEFNHEDKYLLLLANTVLGSGMSSRLHQNVREKYGYCYSIGTFNQSYTDSGLFGVYIGTDKEYVEHVREIIDLEFEKIRTEEVPDKELKEAKAQLKGKLLLSQESTSNRMTRLAKSELYFGRFVSLDELVKNIDAVTAEDLKQFCGNFFDTSIFSETLLMPDSSK